MPSPSRCKSRVAPVIAAAKPPQGSHTSSAPAEKDLRRNLLDILAQVAVLSRVTRTFEDRGVEPSAQERYIAETFCSRAAHRVDSSLKQIETNDDERMTTIAKLAYKRGEYGHALFAE